MSVLCQFYARDVSSMLVVRVGLDLASTINTVISDHECMSRSTTSRESNGSNHVRLRHDFSLTSLERRHARAGPRTRERRAHRRLTAR